MKYSDNASKLKPSITLSITAKAKELKAKGKDVIGFGAGEPDFDTPDHIVKACKDALDSGKTKYIPASGLAELKEAVKNKLKRDNNLEYDNNQIIITTGGKQALSNVFTAMLNPGDEVMMAIPYWVTYPDLVSLNGGVNVFVETEKENDYKYTKENLLKFVSEKTKILVLNSPSNPLGVVYSKGELTMIADFCKEHDIFIISDEIYEPLVYDNEEHISIASLSEDAFNRTLTVNSLSKSYSMTGWRIGYAAGPLKLIKLMTTIQSHTTSNSTTFVQYAAVEALNGDQGFIKVMNNEFKRRRDYMMNKVDNIDKLSYTYPKGAFYLGIDITEILDLNYKGEKIGSSLRFSEILLDDYLVAVVPGIAFGLDNFVRVSYAIDMESIKKGLLRIEEFVNSLDK